VAAAWQQAAAGASLGLMSMRERVLLAGGTFDVQSAPGQGTTIRARLGAGKGHGIHGLHG
jgi:signal transduction histidine kinase